MKGAKYLLEDTSIHGNDLYEFAKMTFDCTYIPHSTVY